MRRCRQFAKWIVVAVATVLVLGLTAYKAEQNAMRRARFRERDFKQEATCALGQEVNKRVQMALMAGLTLGEFAKAFGSPAELNGPKDPKHADMTHSLFHEKSQETFYLRFLDGRLVGYRSNHALSDINTRVVLETPAFLTSESVRTSVLSASLLAWCVALIAGVRTPRFRRKAAVLLATTSILCGLCWFLAPNYSPTLRGVSSNDNLAIFGLLLIASLGFGVIASPRGEDAGTSEGRRRFVAH